jgi:hypothetical protein
VLAGDVLKNTDDGEPGFAVEATGQVLADAVGQVGPAFVLAREEAAGQGLVGQDRETLRGGDRGDVPLVRVAPDQVVQRNASAVSCSGTSGSS